MGTKEKRKSSASSSRQSGADRFPKVFQQFLGDIWAFQPHDAFLCTPVAEKVDAAVPNDFLIDYGKFLVDVRFENENVWLTQEQVAALFDKGRTTITEHIQNAFKEGELDENSVCREFRRTGSDGKESVKSEKSGKGVGLDEILHCVQNDPDEIAAETENR